MPDISPPFEAGTGCQHRLRFYEEAFPAQVVAEFVAQGLADGASCLAVLTPAHAQAVRVCLRDLGVEPADDGWVLIDTERAIQDMTVNGQLDQERAGHLLVSLMNPPAGRKGQPQWFVGDLPATLCDAGRSDDAVVFEGLVHRLSQQHGATVLCAYPLQGLDQRGGMGTLYRLSAVHGGVDFPQNLWVQRWLKPEMPGAATPPAQDR